MNAVVPYLVAFFGVCTYALMGPTAKKIGSELQPFTLMSVASLVLFIFAGLIAYFYERHGVSVMFEKLNPAWLAVYILCNFISYIAYLWAISRIPVAQFEMFGIFVPIVGGFFAWLILKEPFHARYFLALALMGAGIFVAIAPDLRSK